MEINLPKKKRNTEEKYPLLYKGIKMKTKKAKTKENMRYDKLIRSW